MRDLETRIAVRRTEVGMRWMDSTARVRNGHAIAMAIGPLIVGPLMVGTMTVAVSGVGRAQDQPDTVRLELRVFDGSEEVTGECRVRLFPRGQRTTDIPTTVIAGQAITATVPVGFYDAQAIREKKEQVVGLRWAEQLLVQRYPDEYGRHFEAINLKAGYGALQIRPAPHSAAAAKGWTGAAYPVGDATREVAKAVVGTDDLIFALAGGTYDIKLTMADKSTQWMREVEVPSDRTRLKTWTSGAPSPSR